jgi:ribulose-phosphate 3-epimerase
MKVSLSILTVDYAKVEESLRPLLNEIDYVHMDVMDGVFVPNISFGYSFIKSLRKITNKPFDTHLMIEDPIKYIKQFAEAGSQYITIHVEAKSDVLETIKLIKSYGVGAGISIKPNTTVEEIKEYLPLVDMVLVMSVEPGFGGQKFMPSAIDKVKLLKELKKENNYSYLINIDGGINGDTAKYICEYVDMAVSGSYVVNANDPVGNLNILKNI